jgi:hypothetical protein
MYPLGRRIDGPQPQSGNRGEEKKSYHCPCQEFIPDLSASSLFSVLTELPRLPFANCVKCKILYFNHISMVSESILVPYLMSYGLDDRGSRVRFPAGAGNFSLHHCTTASRTFLGPTQLPIQGVPRALPLGVKQPGREADYSPPSRAEVKE